jgi:hypothetical protein
LTIEERVIDIYKKYIEVICPYIIQYELLDGTFPVEILNEIRAVFTHLSKYYLSDDILVKEKNVSKAEGHIKRSILDCYKYICIAYDEKYVDFGRIYKYVDLSLADNGEFLPKLLETHNEAIRLMKDARKTDLLITSDDETSVDEAYEKYEKAFVKYSLVHELINSSYKKLETLKRKAILKIFLLLPDG